MKTTFQFLSAFLIAFGVQKSTAQTPSLVQPSDAGVTTHHVRSVNNGREFRIGITSNAGGVINEIVLPDIGDITDFHADRYGRCTQTSIRDEAHQGKYNPTQAGFNETLGTVISVKRTNNQGNIVNAGEGVISNRKLIVGPFRLALWKADGQYDYTENETGFDNNGNPTVLSDSYDESQNIIPGAADIDLISEPAAQITHTDEVGTPFEFYAEYENFLLSSNVPSTLQQQGASVIRHYTEIQYKNAPDHSLEQFRFGEFIDKKTLDTLPILDQNVLGVPIVDVMPRHKKNNQYATTYEDLTDALTPFNLRFDRALWDPTYRYINIGTWDREHRTDDKAYREQINGSRALIITDEDSINATTGKALGLYKPFSEINEYSIIGRMKATDSIVYSKNRSTLSEANDNRSRTVHMSLLGFTDRLSYLINPTALKERQDINEVFETYRSEVYLVYGTPKECADAIADLELSLVTNQSSQAKVGDAKKAAQETEAKAAVYPNPSYSGLFYLNSAEPWQVYSTTGILIKQGTGKTINLQNAENGFYIIKQGSNTFKVMKQ